MRLSIVVFDGYTALDFIGGYEVLARLPGFEVEFVAPVRGVIAADTRQLGVLATRSLAEVTTTDVLYVPGGPGVEARLADPGFLSHLRALDATSTWTVGICNGVALLAAAGVLTGRQVVTNWGWRDRMRADYGLDVLTVRYHRDGKYLTGAGVSASIDAGLFLAGLIGGEPVARLIQLGIEYYPQPPFGGTGADQAPAAARDLVLAYDREAECTLPETHPSWAPAEGTPCLNVCMQGHPTGAFC